MKTRALSTIISLFIMSFSSAVSQSTLIEISSFGSNPGDLQMFKYVPEQVVKSPALVVVLHGCAQSAEDIARLTEWNKLADRHQFVVLYPQQKTTNNIQKCFNWFLPEDTEKDKGESLSIKEMIGQMVADHSVDTSRIFITGISAGGAMTAVLMSVYPHYFQAGAIMSGVPYGGATNLADAISLMGGGIQKSGEEWAKLIRDQSPDYSGHFPKLIIFQGTDDPIVKAQNADELVKQWGSLHNLSLVPSEKKVLDGLPSVERSSWKKEGKEMLVRYDIEGLGHAIAVDPGEGPRQGGQTDTFAKDVDFYSSYWIADFFEFL